MDSIGRTNEKSALGARQDPVEKTPNKNARASDTDGQRAGSCFSQANRCVTRKARPRARSPPAPRRKRVAGIGANSTRISRERAFDHHRRHGIGKDHGRAPFDRRDLARAGIFLRSPRCQRRLFERTLYLISQTLDELPQVEAQRLADRVVVVDFSSPDPLTSYNIASAWSGSDLDFFATSRVGTFQELLPAGDGLTLRGGAIAKHVLMLLAEQRLPFSYFDHVLSSEPFRARLLSRSEQDDVRDYFRFHFTNEGRATIAAVRARVVSALLSSLSLKLALSGESAPDFRELQDSGKI